MSSTVLGLARYLRDNIVKDDDGEFVSIPECDFCIIGNDDAKCTLEELRQQAENWYGLKVVNAGFNSDCLVVMSDYYGGGCANIAQIWNDGFAPAEGTVQDLCQMIENTLNERELASYDTILLVEFRTNCIHTIECVNEQITEKCFIVVHDSYEGGINTCAYRSEDEVREAVREHIKAVKQELTAKGYDVVELKNSIGESEVYVSDSNIYYKWGIFEAQIH